MPKSILLRGVRHNNLKNLNLDIPIGKLTVLTGVSGSGKSTLAFDVLYAEGQRRYIETFSPYARQFFDRMDKPQADKIENILPAIAIEQRNTVRTSRSTVGTMTEICDYMKVIWPYISHPYCPKCNKSINSIHSPAEVLEQLRTEHPDSTSCIIAFSVPIPSNFSAAEALSAIQNIGYHRAILNQKIVKLKDLPPDYPLDAILIIQDRILLSGKNKKRFIDSCEQAFHYGQGQLTLLTADTLKKIQTYSTRYECPECKITLPKPTPGLFSYNHPIGACPICHGFGRTIGINLDLVIPNPSLTLRQGAVAPWRTGVSSESQADMIKLAKKRKIPLDTPFESLSDKEKKWVIEGDPDYGIDENHQWPQYWYGINGFFSWLEKHSYKMHVRVFLSRYRSYQICEACHGSRFIKESLAYKLPPELTKEDHPLSLADFYNLELSKALDILKIIQKEKSLTKPISCALNEVISRLTYLTQIGLPYLTLNRQTRQLSGGETERVNLTTCLGNKLVNTLYILDEPSVGLHPRDSSRLAEIIKNLKKIGNTVVVVEHESLIIKSADYIIDLGPKAGNQGGEIIFQGPYQKFIQSTQSSTAKYLNNTLRVHLNHPNKTANKGFLQIRSATSNNLHNLNIDIPLGKLICISGVSGSGKSTLIKNIIFPAIKQLLEKGTTHGSYSIQGEDPSSVGNISFPPDSIHDIFLVDQSSIVKTPRSCPAMYIDAFDHIRKFFIWLLKNQNQQSFKTGQFSFNSKSGQCPRCKGLGFEEIEMQFLSNVFIKCPECSGTRFNQETLQATALVRKSSENTVQMNIADILNLTIDEMCSILVNYIQEWRPAANTLALLNIIQKTGLGYLKLSQPLNTLSGGESQRLKLASHIADSISLKKNSAQSSLSRNCYLFDEPSTGLHFEDIQVLLNLFAELVKNGNTIIIIEHNLDIIKCADWVIDMGPEGGKNGGQIIAEGTPEQITLSANSYTGKYLKPLLCTEMNSDSKLSCQ